MTALQPDISHSKLRSYIQNTLLNGRALDDHENLLLNGLLDSLAVMSLVTFVEETFDLKIPFEDVLIENFETINAIEGYLKTRGAHV